MKISRILSAPYVKRAEMQLVVSGMRRLPSYAICIGPFADDSLNLAILPGSSHIVGTSVGDRLTMCIPGCGRHR